MRILIMILALCMGAIPAMATVYEWVDDNGVVNFTDSREKIPAKYRNQAREKDLTQEKNVTIIKDEVPSAPVNTAPSTKARGGLDARRWETRMSALRAEIADIEQGLTAKRQQLIQLQRRRTLYHKAVDRVAINNMGKEIETDEAKLRELQDKLTTLQGQAVEAGGQPGATYP